MSAISIAQQTIGNPVNSFQDALQKAFPDRTISSEDSQMLYDQAKCFFDYKEAEQEALPLSRLPRWSSLSDEDRQGKYDGSLCDARIWKSKLGGGSTRNGYDNIQCSSKKPDGGCLCKKHFRMQNEGKLWTGLITEPRPEEPKKPDGTKMFWSTDKDGNEVVMQKKKSKRGSKKKSSEKKPFTGYTYFGQENKEEITKLAEQNKVRWMSQTASMWKSLSPEEQKSWTDRAGQESLEQQRVTQKQRNPNGLSIDDIERELLTMQRKKAGETEKKNKLQHWKDLEVTRRNS